ncbi:MAG TPA: YrhA family protein, partial [Hymenobacter sp.]
MKQVICRLLAEIAADKVAFDEQMSPPISADELGQLEAECRLKLGYTLPEAYGQLLLVTDGIDLNGIQLYASKARLRVTPEGRTKYSFRGLVEVNEQWREFELNKEFVFLAESGEVLYCHN